MNSYSEQQTFSNPKFIQNTRDKSQNSTSNLNKSISSKSNVQSNSKVCNDIKKLQTSLNQCFNAADCQNNIQLYINDLKRLSMQKLQKASGQRPAYRERSNTSKNRLSHQPSQTSCSELNKSTQIARRDSQTRTSTTKKKDTRPSQNSTASKRTSEILRKYVTALDVTTNSDAKDNSILNSDQRDIKQSLQYSKRDSKDVLSSQDLQKRSSSTSNIKKPIVRETSLNLSYSSKHIAQRKSVIEKSNQARSNSQSTKNSKTSKPNTPLQNYSQIKREANKENQARVSRSRVQEQKQSLMRPLQTNMNIISNKSHHLQTKILNYQISPSNQLSERKVTYSNPFQLQQYSSQKIINEHQSIIDLQQCSSPFNNSHCLPHQPQLMQTGSTVTQHEKHKTELKPMVESYTSLDSKNATNQEQKSQIALIDLSKEVEDLNLVKKNPIEKNQSVILNEGKNIEEMHYQFVNFYQSSRMMLHEIEGAVLTRRDGETDLNTNRLVMVDEITIE